MYMIDGGAEGATPEIGKHAPLPSYLIPQCALYLGENQGYDIVWIVSRGDPSTLHIVYLDDHKVIVNQNLTLPAEMSNENWGKIVADSKGFVFLVGISHAICLHTEEDQTVGIVSTVTYQVPGFADSIVTGANTRFVGNIAGAYNQLFLARGTTDASLPGEIVTLYYDGYGQLQKNQTITYLQQQPLNFHLEQTPDNTNFDLYWTQREPAAGLLYRWKTNEQSLNYTIIPMADPRVQFTPASQIAQEERVALITTAPLPQSDIGFSIYLLDLSSSDSDVIYVYNATDATDARWMTGWARGESYLAASIGYFNTTTGVDEVALLLYDDGEMNSMRNGAVNSVHGGMNSKRNSAMNSVHEGLNDVNPPTCNLVQCGPTADICPPQQMCCEYQRQMFCCEVAPYPT
eukprot:TRINITY_DN1639_c0_g1_i2.p1 TRINITY_DN1639_c0_g1~~TRINITY_DN1639_c0_g1_i2.p1  ORF type:complete len:403 (+),score=74.02 TRINITY_DN1639_c0_g1_i2:279-1487(+)